MIRDLLRTSQARALLFAYALTAVVGAFTPLVDHLGFELAAVLTLVAAIGAPFVGLAAMRLDRTSDPAQRRPALAAARGGLVAVAALLIPVALILLNGLRRPICDPVAGAIWMMLLPVPTAWLGATLGALVGLGFERKRTVMLVVLGIEALSVALGFSRIYFGPAVFVLDHFVGYFPGPIYDVGIPVSVAVVSFRVATVAWGAAAVSTVGAFASVDRAARRMHASWAIALVVALVTVTAAWGTSLGWRTTDASLRAELGGELKADRLVLHFPRSLSERQVESFLRDATYSAAQVERALGITSSEPTHVWLYRDAQQKKRLTGAENVVFAKPHRREIHLQGVGSPEGSLRHELVHAIAADFASGPWRVPGGIIPNMALVEGFAVAFELDAQTLTPMQSARALRDLGRAPDLQRLLSPFGFMTEAGSRAYAYAGAFIRYLDGRFGTPAVRSLYRTGDLATLGDVPTLIADFERMLDTVETDANARASADRRHAQPGIVRQVCAREVEAIVDSAFALSFNRQWDESLAMFDAACALQPENARLRYSKLFVAIRMRPADVGVILAVAESLWAHPELDPELEADSRNAVGDEFWRRGDTGAATAQYRLASALAAGPATRRATSVRLRAIADPFLADLLKPLLAEADASVAQSLRLAAALDTRPRDALVSYLLARQYDRFDAADDAARLMERADSLGLGDGDLTRENLRSLVRVLSTRNRCDESDRALSRLEAAGGTRTEVAVAGDWVGRCRFALSRGWRPL